MRTTVYYRRGSGPEKWKVGGCMVSGPESWGNELHVMGLASKTDMQKKPQKNPTKQQNKIKQNKTNKNKALF